MMTYTWLDGAEARQQLTSLSDLLQACVADGASIGFTDAQDRAVIERIWQDRAALLSSGQNELLVAWQPDAVVGCVMIHAASMPNGRHRAEISKLLVHPRARRQGIARQLMQQAETRTQALGKRLLVLDTRSGNVASLLYRSFGWQTAGSIPAYAESVTGELEATTVMFKPLAVSLDQGLA
ncbi:GNAT family N-acetyltransferase [Candidatus Pantoea persica]|uniref:GNAT family N-acetyltransferase n=1 Tax=Candidatus Pantoea persica TaxID=2518128 RepID=UPI00215D818B|nr:GNAT family N-acetyltransferase [Candidatus Pantoea persica]MBA2815080.1 Acetyltransferase [Candidatus Pantoea persica]